ncbi:hypothetical protein SUDANB95_02236 [Actinosynnema sp. ALI-1.44]
MTAPESEARNAAVKDLLVDTQFLGTHEERVNLKPGAPWDAETPVSFQVIKSGATAIATNSTKWARNAGGPVALLSVIAGGATAFFDGLKVHTAIACTLVAGGAAILVAIAFSTAMIVSADLNARSRATAARTRGRAEITAAFLAARRDTDGKALTDGEAALVSALAGSWTVQVTTAEQAASPVNRVERTTNGLRFVTPEDRLGINEITAWSAVRGGQGNGRA